MYGRHRHPNVANSSIYIPNTTCLGLPKDCRSGQGWCQRGQWGGIYGSPMECLGVVSWRRRRATSPLRVLIRSLGRLPSRSLMRRQISQCLGWGVRDSIGFFQPGQWDSAPEDHRRLGACRKCPEFLKKTSGVLSRLANVMHGMPICCMLHA